MLHIFLDKMFSQYLREKSKNFSLGIIKINSFYLKSACGYIIKMLEYFPLTYEGYLSTLLLLS